LIILNDDEKEIVYLNKEFVDSIELPQHERISFTGGFNETVYGWLFKPINFEEGKKYKVVLLIHGGPESSWTSGWSYTWNPQIYTNQGYAVIMINPHGSSGVSRSFQNAVRHAWGGVPYEDIMTGVQYVIDTYPWIDGEHMCAAGGSYGGFMINWIEGNTDKFKCLINHDGLFSTIPMYYSTDEVWFPMAEFCPQDKIGCRPYESKEIREGFERYSPERFVQNWKTPMLVIHGGLDYRLSLTEALSTFTALQLKKVKSKFLFFPLENHWVLRLENQIKWFEAVLDFIKENIG
jgi:acylaminoacyl-peptidase